MPDITPTPSERTVVVSPNRFGTLTLVSLTLNAIFLVLVLIAIVHHHHHHHLRHGEEFSHDGGGNDGGMRFHHHGFGGGMHGWGRGGGCDASGGQFGGGEERHGWDGGGFQGGDRGFGGPAGGEFHGGDHGFGGQDGGGLGPTGGMKHGPPSATEMTDHIMQHLTGALQLTDQENTQIRPVIEQKVTQLQTQMEAQRQALGKMIDDTAAKIRPMLTADQQKQLDAVKALEELKFNQAKPAGSAPATADDAKPKT